MIFPARISTSTKVCGLVICVTVVLGTLYLLRGSRVPKVIIDGFMQPEVINYTEIISKLNNASVSADYRELVEILRKHFIQPPSKQPYNLSNPEIENPSPKQAQLVDKMLNHMREGFYVDCGAHDGEQLSNSLFFERYRAWSGVLVEPNPFTFQELKGKHRKAFALNACLSKRPEVVTFYTGSEPVLGEIVKPSDNIKVEGGKVIQVQCFPLYSVLLALNQSQVDYFSLDVEGAELGVLESIPLDKVNIRTISIDFSKWRGGKNNLIKYMDNKGYQKTTEVMKIDSARDLIFKKDIKAHIANY